MNDRDKKKADEILGEIDLQYVEEAGRAGEEFFMTGKTPGRFRSLPRLWLKWAGTAAVIMLAFVGLFHLADLALGISKGSRTAQNGSSAEGTADAQEFPGPEGEAVLLGGIPRTYKTNVSSRQGEPVTFPAVLPAGDIQYSTVIYNNQRYTSRGNQLSVSELDRRIGSCEAVIDAAGSTVSAFTADAYAIRSVSEKYFIAVEIDGKYICFMTENFKAPATLGEFLDAFCPSDTFNVLYFYALMYPGYDDIYFADDYSPLWEYLESFRNAKLTTDTDLEPAPSEWAYNTEITGWVYDFEINSPVLGGDEKAMYICSDGRIIIGLFGTPIAYKAGPGAWSRVMDVLNYMRLDEATNKNYFVGTVIEVGEDYILVDDAISCQKESDGIVFRVFPENSVHTDDLVKRNYIYSKEFHVGDKVYVGFTGNIDPETMTVNGVFNIGIIYDIQRILELSQLESCYDIERDADGFIRKIRLKPEMSQYRNSIWYDASSLAKMKEDARAVFRAIHGEYLTEGSEIDVQITTDKSLNHAVRYYFEMEERVNGTATGTHALMQFSTEGVLDEACFWDSRNGNLIAIEEAALIGKQAIYERGGLYDMMTFVSQNSYLVNYGDSLAWLVVIEHNEWISNKHPFWSGSKYTTFYVDAYNGEILEYADN